MLNINKSGLSILLPGQSGYGILIENDAGFISHDLNSQLITESFELKNW